MLNFQKRAVFAAESLIKKYENFYTFFKQNEHNLEAIDVELMSSEHAGAGRDLVKVLKSMKKILEKEFGFKNKKKKIDVLKLQEGIQVEKKMNAFDMMKNGKSKPKANIEEEDLLGGMAEPEVKKTDSFGFLNKKSNNPPAEAQEEDILGIGGSPAKQQDLNDDFNLLDLNMNETETPITQNDDNDLMGLDLGQNGGNDDGGIDLLGGMGNYQPEKPKKKKHDPFGFI